jgi:hypothetical protein
MVQSTLDFTTHSPVNAERITGQNRRLYDWLANGNSIHCFSPAKRELRIGYLNSRASDLINKHNIPVQKKWVQVEDVDGMTVTVVEYSITITPKCDKRNNHGIE